MTDIEALKILSAYQARRKCNHYQQDELTQAIEIAIEALLEKNNLTESKK